MHEEQSFVLEEFQMFIDLQILFHIYLKVGQFTNLRQMHFEGYLSHLLLFINLKLYLALFHA